MLVTTEALLLRISTSVRKEREERDQEIKGQSDRSSTHSKRPKQRNALKSSLSQTETIPSDPPTANLLIARAVMVVVVDMVVVVVEVSSRVWKEMMRKVDGPS